MAEKNTGKSYEELVQEIYQAILDYENADAGYQKIEVRHNVKLKGKTGNFHQIDVYWAFMLSGIKYETLVEIKDWKNPVKMEQINSFKAVLDDVPGFPKGIYVSRSGFQLGAIKTAEHHGIKLVTIQNTQPSLKILINNIVTYYDGVSIDVDVDWAEYEGISESEIERLGKSTTQEKVILLNSNKINVRLYDLMCDSARPFYYEKDNIRHTVEESLEGDWFWLTGDTKIPRIKIKGYGFQCYNKSASAMLEVTVPQYVITDMLEQRRHLYNSVTKAIKLNIPQDCLL